MSFLTYYIYCSFEMSKDLQFAIGVLHINENCMVFHGMANKRQIFENYNNLDVFSNL